MLIGVGILLWNDGPRTASSNRRHTFITAGALTNTQNYFSAHKPGKFTGQNDPVVGQAWVDLARLHSISDQLGLKPRAASAHTLHTMD